LVIVYENKNSTVLQAGCHRDSVKVDLYTWTKNGAKTLIPVLKMIDRVIPIEEVEGKIA
jgi:hypothetical protein